MTEFNALIADTPVYLQMAILFGVALLFATVVTLGAFAVIRSTAERIESYTLSAVAKRMRDVTFWVLTLFLTVIFWTGLREQGVDGAGATGNPFYLLPGIRIVRTLLYINFAILVFRAVNVGADTVRHRFNVDHTNNLHERKVLTQLQYIQRVIGIVIFVVTVAFILLQFPSVRNLGTGLFAGVGVGGIIIGLAAQKSISNLLAGFQIAFTQPIRLDDVLIVNGEFGRVEEITLTYVTLKLWDLRRLIVPLNKFIDDSFQNWTRSSSQLIGSVFLYLDYTFPVAELRAEAERYVRAHGSWDGETFNAKVTDNNAEAITVRILASAVDAGTTFDLRCDIREHLIGWVQENHVAHLPRTRVELGAEGGAALPDGPGSQDGPVVA